MEQDRKDKSAAGWDEKVDLAKHESQKGKALFCHLEGVSAELIKDVTDYTKFCSLYHFYFSMKSI